jgi:transcriptional regulator of acetoin/glycerol metabolism
MRRSGVDQTTAPAAASTGSQKGEPSLAVRWVWPKTAGALTPLERARLVLGRDAECDVVLDGRETSRVHAEIVAEGPIHVVRDLDSRNGVHHNGEKVAQALLASGDVLRFGDCIGVVCEHENGAADFGFSAIEGDLFVGPIVGAAVDLARRAAAGDLPIVLCGETGTGKDRLARCVHAWSGREGPFLAVNCAALPASLAEAELFGYRKGAFTGADRNSPGHFRAADGGTLFLDELTDLSVPVQAKLLRALEQREVLPLGESAPVKVDARVLAATQEPLLAAVDDKRLRADLAARLDGITIVLLPLRERQVEIPYLFERLLELHAGGRPPRVEPRLVEELLRYDWPFNVRELDLLVRRLLVLQGVEPILKRASLPEHVLVRGSAASAAPSAEKPARVDAGALAQALRQTRGNLARAAAALGISRQRAYRLLEEQPAIDLAAMRSSS